MPQAVLKQATIDYRELGPEDSPHPPVLFVHGALVDGRLWAHVADGLARQGFRCIVPTWPLGAHTIAVNDGADLSPPGLATMIRDFMAAVGLADVTLVGNDSGGGLCQFVIDAHEICQCWQTRSVSPMAGRVERLLQDVAWLASRR